MAGLDDMGLGSDAAAPAMGDESSEPAGFEPADDFEREAKDFLDDSLPMESRIMALKEAIRLCAEKDYGSGDSEKPGGGLAMIFGGAPKKKS